MNTENNSFIDEISNIKKQRNMLVEQIKILLHDKDNLLRKEEKNEDQIREIKESLNWYQTQEQKISYQIMKNPLTRMVIYAWIVFIACLACTLMNVLSFCSIIIPLLGSLGIEYGVRKKGKAKQEEKEELMASLEQKMEIKKELKRELYTNEEQYMRTKDNLNTAVKQLVLLYNEKNQKETNAEERKAENFVEQNKIFEENEKQKIKKRP